MTCEITMIDDIRWLVAERVLVLELFGVLSLADVREARALIKQKLPEQRPHPIHILLDMTRRSEYDKSLFSLKAVREAIIMEHSIYKGCILLIDPYPNPAVQIIASTVAGLFRFQMFFVRDFSEALKLLRSVDASLANAG